MIKKISSVYFINLNKIYFTYYMNWVKYRFRRNCDKCTCSTVVIASTSAPLQRIMDTLRQPFWHLLHHWLMPRCISPIADKLCLHSMSWCPVNKHQGQTRKKLCHVTHNYSPVVNGEDAILSICDWGHNWDPVLVMLSVMQSASTYVNCEFWWFVFETALCDEVFR